MVFTTESLEYVNLVEDDQVSVTGLINEMQSDNETGYSSTDSKEYSEDEKEEVKTGGTGGKAPRAQILIRKGINMTERKRERQRQ